VSDILGDIRDEGVGLWQVAGATSWGVVVRPTDTWAWLLELIDISVSGGRNWDLDLGSGMGSNLITHRCRHWALQTLCLSKARWRDILERGWSERS
jgi:hypothetical protein